MTDREVTAEDVRAAAERAGLQLTEAEADKLVKGVSRGRRMSEVLRKYVTPDVEPAGVFGARAMEE
jgi:ribosomal protein L12E/L44/L45/RPP1/RPP2